MLLPPGSGRRRQPAHVTPVADPTRVTRREPRWIRSLTGGASRGSEATRRVPQPSRPYGQSVVHFATSPRAPTAPAANGSRGRVPCAPPELAARVRGAALPQGFPASSLSPSQGRRWGGMVPALCRPRDEPGGPEAEGLEPCDVSDLLGRRLLEAGRRWDRFHCGEVALVQRAGGVSARRRKVRKSSRSTFLRAGPLTDSRFPGRPRRGVASTGARLSTGWLPPYGRFWSGTPLAFPNRVVPAERRIEEHPCCADKALRAQSDGPAHDAHLAARWKSDAFDTCSPRPSRPNADGGRTSADRQGVLAPAQGSAMVSARQRPRELGCRTSQDRTGSRT